MLRPSLSTVESGEPAQAYDATEKAALEMFHAADKNRNGSLSHTEIKKHMKAEPWVRALLAGEEFHWKVRVHLLRNRHMSSKGARLTLCVFSGSLRCTRHGRRW